MQSQPNGDQGGMESHKILRVVSSDIDILVL